MKVNKLAKVLLLVLFMVSSICNPAFADNLASPKLEADSSDVFVGNDVEITFIDDELWRAAISEITIDCGSDILAACTVGEGSIVIPAANFSQPGDYVIMAKATDYEDAAVTQTIEAFPAPTLNAASCVEAGENVVLTFTDDPAWRAAISSITVAGEALESSMYNTMVTGELTIDASFFTAANEYAIVIKATGYMDVAVTQGVYKWTSDMNLSDDVTREAITLSMPNTPAYTAWVAAINKVVVQKDQDDPVEFPLGTVQTYSNQNQYFTSGRALLLGALDFFKTVGTYTITVTATDYDDFVYSYTVVTPADNRAPVRSSSLGIFRFTYSDTVDEFSVPIGNIAVDKDGDELIFDGYTPDAGAQFYTIRYDEPADSIVITAAWDEAPDSGNMLMSTVPVMIREATTAEQYSVTVNLNIMMERANGAAWTADVSANSSFDSTAGTAFGDVTINGSISSNVGEYFGDNLYKVTVNGTVVPADKYTLGGTATKPTVALDKSLFTAVGSYTISVRAKCFTPTSVTQSILAPLSTGSVSADSPTLIYSDFSQTPLTIDFAGNITASDITTVRFFPPDSSGIKLINATHRTLADNRMTIKTPSSDSTYFATVAGTGKVVITVPGYPNIEVPYKMTALADSAPVINADPAPVFMGEDFILSFDKNDPAAVAYVQSIDYITESNNSFGYTADLQAGTITIEGKKGDGSNYFTFAGNKTLNIITEGYPLGKVAIQVSNRLSPTVAAAEETVAAYSSSPIVFNYDKTHERADDWLDSISSIQVFTPAGPFTILVDDWAIDKMAGTITVNAAAVEKYFFLVGNFKVVIKSTSYDDVIFYQNVATPINPADSTIPYLGHIKYDKEAPLPVSWTIDFGDDTFKLAKLNASQLSASDLTINTGEGGTTIEINKSYLDKLPEEMNITLSFVNDKDETVAFATFHVCRDSALVLSIKEGENLIKTFTLTELKALGTAEGDKTYNVSKLNSYGTSELEYGLMGPTMRGVLEMAYNNTLEAEFGAANFSTTTMQVKAPDGFVQTPTFADVFNTRYYFPNLTAADEAVKAEGKEVLPAFISWNVDNGKFVFGQYNPTDMNNPFMVKSLFKDGVGLIIVTRDAVLNQISSDYVTGAVLGGVSVAPGGTAASSVTAGVDKLVELTIPKLDQYIDLYYTVSKDGTTPADPSLTSENGVYKYNVKTYSAPFIFNYPVLDTPGTTIIKAQAYKVGMLPSQVYTFTFKVQAIPAPVGKYSITIVEDAKYDNGQTPEGIYFMTVKNNVTEFNYFAVDVTPDVEHSGEETVLFTHLRGGVQLAINATKADFDIVSCAKAGFNILPGDVVKAYIVDELTNDPDRNPHILQ